MLGASAIQPPVNAVAVVQSSSPQSGSPSKMTRKIIREKPRSPPDPNANLNDASVLMPLLVSFALPDTCDVQKFKVVSVSDLHKSKADGEKSKPNPEPVLSKDKVQKSKAGVNDKATGVQKSKVVSVSDKAAVVNDKATGVIDKAAGVNDKAVVGVNDAASGVNDKSSAEAISDLKKSKAGDLNVQKPISKAALPKPDVEKFLVSKSKSNPVSAVQNVKVQKSKGKVQVTAKAAEKSSYKEKAKAKDKPKSTDLSRKRKLADNKEGSGEPLKLSKKPRGKMIKWKRVSSSDEVGSDSSDDDDVVVKKNKRRKVSDEANRKSGSKLKNLLMGEDDDIESFKRMFKKLKGFISDSEDESVVRKPKREVRKPMGKIKRDGGDDMRDVSEPKREVKKPKGKIKREGSDEDGANVKNPKRLGKKNIVLSKDEIEQLEYLKEFPLLRVRNAPCSLFTSIRQSKVDMLRFLTEVGFESFHRIFIDKLPSKLGRLVASIFDPTTYKLNLFNGLSILVTPQKIHDILGIPVGGTSLFSFEERPVTHPFVKSWVEQFYPKSFKEIRAPDIGIKLVNANRVDDLFKLNFLMLFSNVIGRCDTMGGQLCFDVVRRIPEHLPISEIDWCGYIHDCLQYSINPKGECHYYGPLAVLMVSL